MAKLTGKVALVTGGSRGIGRGVVLKLAQAGASVAINYHKNAAQADEVVQAVKQQGIDAIALQGDMSNLADIERVAAQTFEHFKRLDMLVSNAGIELFRGLAETTQEDFDRIFSINTRGQFFAVQQAVKYMQSSGHIVCTSSVSAVKPYLHHALYSASKAAVITLVQNLALELGPRGITINAIAPGGTQTDMAAENAKNYLDPNLKIAPEVWLKSSVALGRLGTIEEIADVICFLVSEDARWITGQVIRVDGGVH